MLINYPYKFRLEPTEEQETLLYHYGFTCRFIYNLALDQRNLSRDPSPSAPSSSPRHGHRLYWMIVSPPIPIEQELVLTL